MSLQEGFRLMEKIELAIGGATFSGTGTDPDGQFVIEGTYDATTNLVTMTRRYVVAPKNPSQIGYPFDYWGRWDGALVAGRWMMRTSPTEGDAFEMWPVSEEQKLEEAMAVDELANVR